MLLLRIYHENYNTLLYIYALITSTLPCTDSEKIVLGTVESSTKNIILCSLPDQTSLDNSVSQIQIQLYFTFDRIIYTIVFYSRKNKIIKVKGFLKKIIYQLSHA